jgi:hypothetical protein
MITVVGSDDRRTGREIGKCGADDRRPPMRRGKNRYDIQCRSENDWRRRTQYCRRSQHLTDWTRVLVLWIVILREGR